MKLNAWLNKFLTRSLFVSSSLEFNAFHVRIKFSIFVPRDLATLTSLLLLEISAIHQLRERNIDSNMRRTLSRFPGVT